MKANRHWLDDYALFSVWHGQFGRGWFDWPSGPRDRDPHALNGARQEHGDAILRTKWTQWQLDLQWRNARRGASAFGVELMGDLPFVVGIDSADVWSNGRLFRIDQHVGTPPDESSETGQDWGLPVYDWEAFKDDDFAWIKARAMRAGQLYSIYRVDHALGSIGPTFARPTANRAGSPRPTNVGRWRWVSESCES